MVLSSCMCEGFKLESKVDIELLLEGGLLLIRGTWGKVGIFWWFFIIRVLVTVLFVGGILGGSLVRIFSLMHRV